MIGEKIGRWEIISGPSFRNEYGRKTKWYFCQCKCGTQREVRYNTLQQRRSTSCGCLRTENIPKGKDRPQYKHGHTASGKRSREWRTWNAMIRRCTYPSMTCYPRYGGRGITVCDRWLNSFSAFLADVGFAPSESYSIDRINNDGNYEPENIRWATNSEQIKNSSKARLITFNGITKHIGEWADETGINRQTIQMRLDKYAWSIEKTLTTTVNKRKV